MTNVLIPGDLYTAVLQTIGQLPYAQVSRLMAALDQRRVIVEEPPEPRPGAMNSQ